MTLTRYPSKPADVPPTSGTPLTPRPLVFILIRGRNGMEVELA
jgi:hypothetical protein